MEGKAHIHNACGNAQCYHAYVIGTWALIKAPSSSSIIVIQK